ncbi:hypothetical protein C3L33_08571, partial [Rhododendron williamsianum]
AWGSKFIRALPIYISGAADAAGASTRSRAEFHWHIEPIYERYVKQVRGVELVQCIFNKCVRGLAERLALEDPTAVTGLARSTACPIEIAAGSGPYPGSHCACWRIDGPSLALVKAAATTRHGGGPNSVGTVVFDTQSGAWVEVVVKWREMRRKREKARELQNPIKCIPNEGIRRGYGSDCLWINGRVLPTSATHSPAPPPLATPSPFSFSVASTRWSSRPSIYISSLFLRFLALIFSFASALALAVPSPKKTTGKGDSSFGDYPELLYSFIVTILAFVYSAYQLFKGVSDIVYRGILISDMASDYLSFILDQVICFA